jgi:hypothetical protein
MDLILVGCELGGHCDYLIVSIVGGDRVMTGCKGQIEESGRRRFSTRSNEMRVYLW